MKLSTHIRAKTNRQKEIQTHRQRDKQTHKHTDIQRDSQTDRQGCRFMFKHKFWSRSEKY